MRQSFAVKELYAESLIGPAVSFGPEYWLDPTRGSNGNSGQSWKAPWKTLEYAESKLEGGKNETLYYVASATTAAPTGGGSGNTLSAALTWDKSYTHLVGVSPLGGTGNRCRIFGASTLTDASLITVSGTGCIFKNISVFYGVASAAAKYAVTVTGSRNLFDTVRIAGIGNDTQDVADAASLFLNGAAENEFRNSTIGLTTIGRGTATNTEIQVDSSAARNLFVGGRIICRADAADHTFVTVADSTGAQDWNEFTGVQFMNTSTNHAITMSSAITIPANPSTMAFYINDCIMSGCADWEVNNRGQVFVFNSPAATAATDGRGWKVV
jgi:hypothetical protein